MKSKGKYKNFLDWFLDSFFMGGECPAFPFEKSGHIKYTLPGTTIVSDGWEAHTSIEKEGYTH